MGVQIHNFRVRVHVAHAAYKRNRTQEGEGVTAKSWVRRTGAWGQLGSLELGQLESSPNHQDEDWLGPK